MNIIVATRLVAGLPKSIVFITPDTVTAHGVLGHLKGKMGWSVNIFTGDCVEVVTDAKQVAKLLKDNMP